MFDPQALSYVSHSSADFGAPFANADYMDVNKTFDNLYNNK